MDYSYDTKALCDVISHQRFWNIRKQNKEIPVMMNPLPTEEEDIPEIEGRAIYTNLVAIGEGAMNIVLGRQGERSGDVWRNYLMEDLDGDENLNKLYNARRVKRFLNTIDSKQYFFNGSYSGFRTVTDSIVFCFGEHLPKTLQKEDDPTSWWSQVIGHGFEGGLSKNDPLNAFGQKLDHDLLTFFMMIKQKSLLLGFEKQTFENRISNGELFDFSSCTGSPNACMHEANEDYMQHITIIPKNTRVMLDFASIWIVHGMVILHTSV